MSFPIRGSAGFNNRVRSWLRDRFSQRGPISLEFAILSRTSRTFYAKTNSPAVRAVACHDSIHAHRRVFRRGAGTRADTAGSYHDIRADCREGRAERCNSVYDSDSVARSLTVSVFR